MNDDLRALQYAINVIYKYCMKHHHECDMCLLRDLMDCDEYYLCEIPEMWGRRRK